eukprot:7700647-Alexandrium_andersonii.AAC.1
MTERPSSRRSTSWVLLRPRDDGSVREPSAAAAAEEEGAPAPATPRAAMNKLGWAQEQIDARKALEESGQLPAWGG